MLRGAQPKFLGIRVAYVGGQGFGVGSGNVHDGARGRPRAAAPLEGEETLNKLKEGEVAAEAANEGGEAAGLVE